MIDHSSNGLELRRNSQTGYHPKNSFDFTIEKVFLSVIDDVTWFDVISSNSYEVKAHVYNMSSRANLVGKASES
jgi:hypothetical protein